MSRQYDEYIDGCFELYGETYRIIEPSNIKEFAEALELSEKIQNRLDACMHHDDDIGNWEQLLEEQNSYIDEYIEGLPEYDNTIFNENLSFLLDKYSMRIGGLENVLHLSPGYISRTSKKDSAKKLSIDVVWKISEFFEVDLEKLLCSSMKMPDKNSELIMKFVDKLYKKTQSHEIEWANVGGFEFYLHSEYEQLDLIKENQNEEADDDVPIYKPDGLNPNVEFYLTGDIFSCKGVIPDSEVLIVPFSHSMEGVMDYEFFVVTKDEKGKMRKKLMFSTARECFAALGWNADKLYDLIMKYSLDTTLAPDVKNMMRDFLDE